MRRRPARRRNQFRADKEVRKLARERVGKVPSSRVIQPKSRRQDPKHPKREKENWSED